MKLDEEQAVVVAIDFDGVIHPYSDDWKGMGVFDPPSAGCQEALEELKDKGYTVLIYSCRGEVTSITDYMERWSLPFDYINEQPTYHKSNDGFVQSPRKIAADIYVDDHGLRFTGDWATTVAAIDSYALWYDRSPEHFKYSNRVGLKAREQSVEQLARKYLQSNTVPYLRSLQNLDDCSSSTKEWIEAVLLHLSQLIINEGDQSISE